MKDDGTTPSEGWGKRCKIRKERALVWQHLDGEHVGINCAKDFFYFADLRSTE